MLSITERWSRDTIATPMPERPTASTWLALAAQTLREWRRRARSRHALATMSCRERRDLGLMPDVVWREAGKPFWSQ
jgi:uncharacterized protein YjiS (DUF1127 family)